MVAMKKVALMVQNFLQGKSNFITQKSTNSVSEGPMLSFKKSNSLPEDLDDSKAFVSPFSFTSENLTSTLTKVCRRKKLRALGFGSQEGMVVQDNNCSGTYFAIGRLLKI